ncbi:hypothetical protein LXL04_037676 [Taraxacum kok-saghyz]
MVDANASNPDLPQYSDDQFLRALTAFKEIEKRLPMKKFTNVSWKLLSIELKQETSASESLRDTRFLF